MMIGSRLSLRLRQFILPTVVVGLLFWGYQAHLHETVRSLTKETLSNQLAKLKETFGGDANSEEILSGLKDLTKQLQEKLESQGEQQQQKRPEKTLDSEFARRRRKVQDVCSVPFRVPGRVHGVFTHARSGVIYCFVPKAGCTFWKRIFRAVKTQVNATKESVFSISRNLVHSVGGGGIPYKPANYTVEQYPTRVIVTRDPYSRLLSSYLDKVYLPDFWATEMKPLLRHRLTSVRHSADFNSSISTKEPEPDFLRQHFDQMDAIFGFGQNFTKSGVSTARERDCGKYVTFSEFVQIGFKRAEPHWMPIHQICNPCQFNVTHVSRMETFTEDARVILAQMGLEDILDDIDADAQVDEELRTIVNYNFYRVYNDTLTTFFRSCITAPELAYRLWHNFRWRGYIDPDVEYKVPEFKDLGRVKEDLLEQIWSARKSGLMNPERMKKAKKEFQDMAFATISKRMFQDLDDKYKIDFELFGYKEVRDKLFSKYYKT